ncbi:MAG: hypothetical protein AAFW89_11785 [Bacteroidota bacterium]
MNRRILYVAFSICFVGSLSLQAQNPYKSLGVEMETLTLSKGKYPEFFTNDSLVRIGSVILDIRNNQITDFVVFDTTYSEATLEPEVSSRFLQQDPYAAKFPNVSPYVYTLNNPVRLVDPDGRAPKDPFLITVRTYIPQKRALGFHGDNRSRSTATDASYRTSHSVGVETNPNVSSNPLTSNDGGRTGLTATTVGLPPTGAPLMGKAPEGAEGGFSASVSRSYANGGDNAVLRIVGSSKNPITDGLGIPTPAIDYDFTISIIPGEDGGAPTVNVSGSHDGFPGYEINITDQNNGQVYQVYYHEPTSQFQLRRLADKEDEQVKVDQ